MLSCIGSKLSVAQLVEHVTVDVCDHRVAGSIPAAETLLPLGALAKAGSEASLAQSVERKALNLVVVGSSPTGGVVSAVASARAT